MSSTSFSTFAEAAERGNLVPVATRLMADQLTPVLAYRRLVEPDTRIAPSFLLESVENGSSVGRFSFLAARPTREILAYGTSVTVRNHQTGAEDHFEQEDPLLLPPRFTESWRCSPWPGHPSTRPRAGFRGGWVGNVGYDAVRYLEPAKLPFASAPPDDRSIADVHLGLYQDVVIFDHVEKLLHVVCHVLTDEHDTTRGAYDAGERRVDAIVERLMTPGPALAAGVVGLDLSSLPHASLHGTFGREAFEQGVERCREYIAAGDAFQIVLSQRFERETDADPFDVYRALRVVNPSPYMIYLQAADAILVGASPEILCRVEGELVTSRPLAGTRRRGTTPDEDAANEADLRLDEKERAEHVMLVDLGRNDIGKVCRKGSIELPRLLDVERYSHVMHLASTVTGVLREDLDAWAALRATLPVGTVSGAPKVRAMQIIDELEPTRRGPYGGGIGVVGFNGDMDMAIALRTMVFPTRNWSGGRWTVHLQAGAGIVADSVPATERQETVSKAAALARAIDLAEEVMGSTSR